MTCWRNLTIPEISFPGVAPRITRNGAIALEIVDVVSLQRAIQAGLGIASGLNMGVAFNEFSQNLQKIQEGLGSRIKEGDKTPKGREYSAHGAKRANQRQFDSQKIDNIIDNNYKHRVKEISPSGEVRWRNFYR